MKSAPSILDYLTKEEKENFDKVKKYLDVLDIKYVIDNTLVRGLDYYTNLVFEFISDDVDDIGSIGGGGRYDNLLKSLGGPDIPSVGFAFGMDRVVSVLTSLEIKLPINNDLDVYILNISEKEFNYSIELLQNLRMCGYRADMDLSNKNMKGKFKEVDRYNSKYIIIIGEDEVKTGILTVKDNITKEETKVNYDDLIDFLDTNV